MIVFKNFFCTMAMLVKYLRITFKSGTSAFDVDLHLFIVDDGLKYNSIVLFCSLV